jgi:hypothetical protein
MNKARALMFSSRFLSWCQEYCQRKGFSYERLSNNVDSFWITNAAYIAGYNAKTRDVKNKLQSMKTMDLLESLFAKEKKMKIKELLKLIEENFIIRLSEKTGWGRNEVLSAYKASVAAALIKAVEDATE